MSIPTDKSISLFICVSLLQTEPGIANRGNAHSGSLVSTEFSPRQLTPLPLGVCTCVYMDVCGTSASFLVGMQSSEIAENRDPRPGKVNLLEVRTGWPWVAIFSLGT